MKVHDLYEPFIERDLAAIPAAVRAFREEHSSDDLFLAVARFAVLAFAPSQHAKHALLCCLTAHDLRAALGERFDDALSECAVYVAASRQPWSEPPILDPPHVEPDHPNDVAEMLAAIDTGDRLRAERWLAATPSKATYFAVAASDFEDLGHKLIVADAAWRLADLLGEKGRYAALRVGVWECAAYTGERFVEKGVNVDGDELLGRLVEDVVREQGSMTSAHAIFLLDAAMQTGEERIVRRVREYLGEQTGLSRGQAPRLSGQSGHLSSTVPIYSFARDLGASFKARAVASRLGLDARFLAAVDWNRENGPSFEDFSFA